MNHDHEETMGPKNGIIGESSGSTEMDSEERAVELMEMLEREESLDFVAGSASLVLALGEQPFLRITTSIQVYDASFISIVLSYLLHAQSQEWL
jgi:hypothetical protein